MTSERIRATELEYLKWFRCNCDFGPAHSDVIAWLNNKFTEDTGLYLPENWEPEPEYQEYGEE
jgi:hypothetical protein